MNRNIKRHIEFTIMLYTMPWSPCTLLLRWTTLASNDRKCESDLNFFLFLHTGCRWRSSIIVSSHRCGTRRRILCLWNEGKTDWCSPFDSDGTRHRFLTRANTQWFDRYNYTLTISRLTSQCFRNPIKFKQFWQICELKNKILSKSGRNLIAQRQPLIASTCYKRCSAKNG